MPPQQVDLNQLPPGWIQEFDPNQAHPYWVDTRANPPRAIWTHPFQDEQFLSEHPEYREMIQGPSSSSPPPPGYDEAVGDNRRHSYHGDTKKRPVDELGDDFGAGPSKVAAASHPTTPQAHPDKHRGFFGKLKDKAIGTKEEREAAREARKREEAALAERQRQLRQERLRKLQEMQAQQPERFQQRYGGYSGFSGFPGNSQQRYGAPAGYPQPYLSGPSYGYGRPAGYGTSGFGGGGAALPLLGGLAGGLLIGDLIGDAFDPGFGGGFGGGFDGGFGGGGFF